MSQKSGASKIIDSTKAQQTNQSRPQDQKTRNNSENRIINPQTKNVPARRRVLWNWRHKQQGFYPNEPAKNQGV